LTAEERKPCMRFPPSIIVIQGMVPSLHNR